MYILLTNNILSSRPDGATAVCGLKPRTAKLAMLSGREKCLSHPLITNYTSQ